MTVIIPRIQVRSSNVRSVGYDSARRLLHVEFNGKDTRMPGRVYEYVEVPPEAHRALMEAQSKGAHFARYVKWAYPSKLVQTPGPMVTAAEKEAPV